MPSTRAFAIAAAICGFAAAAAGAAIVILYLAVAVLGRFDSPVDDTPLNWSFGVGALLGGALIALSRFWLKERRNAFRGILFGVGAGIIVDAAVYVALGGH